MDSNLIDTSSLVSLARYYHPFDESGDLYNYVKERFDKQEWLLLETVQVEIGTVSKGLATERYPFLANIKPYPSHGTLITNKQRKTIASKWVVKDQKLNLKKEMMQHNPNLNITDETIAERIDAEIEIELKHADFQLILTAKNLIANAPPLLPDPVAIVTEETPWPNDGKLFKKIPAICGENIENIPCITLPELLKNSGIPLHM